MERKWKICIMLFLISGISFFIPMTAKAEINWWWLDDLTDSFDQENKDEENESTSVYCLTMSADKYELTADGSDQAKIEICLQQENGISKEEQNNMGVSVSITADNTLTQADLYEIILDRLGLTHIEALQEINPDVVGWIYITATDISYPLLQGEDNDTYLHSSWTDKTKTLKAGSIFMDSSNSPDFSDFNTIIYGHRMQNETMFGKLKYFRTKDYWQTHPDVYIVTAEKILRYDIYATYEVSVQGKTYLIDFDGEESRCEYIDYTLGMARYDTGVVPTGNDSILTLITCTASDSSARWAVQAVMQEEILRYTN